MSFLRTALDAGKPVPGFPATAVASGRCGGRGFFMASPIKSRQKLESRKPKNPESQKARKSGL